jgi:phosphoglycolate phosphatase-like HAD superfamily hydrolase
MALLLFDIDGTLLDMKGSGREASNKTLEKYFGIKNAFNSVPMMGRTDKYIWKMVCEKNNIPLKVFKKLKKLILKDYYKFLKEELKKRKNVMVYPGLKEILNYCSKNGHYLGLLTGNFKKSAYIKLEHFGLDKYFQVGGFGDDNEQRTKVAELAIKRAKKYFKKNFNNKEIFIIGDTPFDIECAKATNTISVAVATGGYSYNELKLFKPDFLFNSLENYKEFIKIIDSNKL